jgi:hypothetical protein
MNTKLAGLALLIGSSFLVPENVYSQRGIIRNSEVQSYNAPVTQKVNPQNLEKESAPFIQIYDSRIVIDEDKKELFKNYLEKRVKTSNDISDYYQHLFSIGMIRFDTIANESSKHIIYESALEAMVSGDRNVYDMVLKNTAWRNDILIGLKPDLLKKNLDKKYKIAKRLYIGMDELFKRGAAFTICDMSKSKGVLDDLEFMYRVMDLELPEDEKINPSEIFSNPMRIEGEKIENK